MMVSGLGLAEQVPLLPQLHALTQELAQPLANRTSSPTRTRHGVYRLLLG